MSEMGAVNEIDPDDRAGIGQVGGNVAHLEFDWKPGLTEPAQQRCFRRRGRIKRVLQVLPEVLADIGVAFAVVEALLQLIAGNAV